MCSCWSAQIRHCQGRIHTTVLGSRYPMYPSHFDSGPFLFWLGQDPKKQSTNKFRPKLLSAKEKWPTWHRSDTVTGVLVQRDDERQDCRAPSSSLYDSHLDARMEQPWQVWGAGLPGLHPATCWFIMTSRCSKRSLQYELCHKAMEWAWNHDSDDIVILFP